MHGWAELLNFLNGSVVTTLSFLKTNSVAVERVEEQLRRSEVTWSLERLSGGSVNLVSVLGKGQNSGGTGVFVSRSPSPPPF